MSNETVESTDVALKVENLKIRFGDESKGLAIDGVSFEVRRGKTLAIVGESGCGKSVTAYSILRLLQAPGKIVSGNIHLASESLGDIDIAEIEDGDERLFQLRGGVIGMIFQEPMTALSPVHRVGEQIAEALLLHQTIDEETAKSRVLSILRKVGMTHPESRYDQYPHELSGGLRQRIVIAMALITRPELVIADEPTTALDATVQMQILRLIKQMQEEIACSVLLITHDFGVVAQVADDVAVMYLGRIVESGPVEQIFDTPLHPYTKGLLKSLPINAVDGRMNAIPGSVPQLTDRDECCPFRSRCVHAKTGICDQATSSVLREVYRTHKVACIRAEELLQERTGNER